MRAVVVELAVMAGIAVVLALVGPFGSYGTGSFAHRLAYWLPAAMVGYAIFRPLHFVAEHAALRLSLPRWAGWLLALLAGGVPGTFFIAWLGGRSPDRLSFDGFASLYANVVVLSAVVLAVFLAIERNVERPATSTAEPPARAPFLDRLSPGFALPLVALEMEDHYVRAHGAGGRSELVLMRMRDAVAELDPALGERVHRSWWVARDAVSGRRRDGRNLVLMLGSLEAPVARDRVADLKAKGWF